MSDMEHEPRTLTAGDVKAIGDALEKRLTDKFYNDLGKGVWGFIWRALMLVGLALAAFGAGKGFVVPTGHQ